MAGGFVPEAAGQTLSGGIPGEMGPIPPILVAMGLMFLLAIAGLAAGAVWDT